MEAAGQVNNGLMDEFRRRGVLRVAALYVIAAWLIIQVADVTRAGMDFVTNNASRI